jgi:UDP-2,3-diacylglucosamine pyrophosphatase LpxH
MVAIITADDGQKKPGVSSRGEAPATYYFISDLHIGGDGDLDQCDFEVELIAFLRRIADGPLPAELIIIGDAFGLWELTEVKDDTKVERIAKSHPELFEQFRETGRRIRITLVPGNHDYELACVLSYKDVLAAFNIHLEPETYIIREVAGRKLWIEHGNQRDAFNTFPDFGNRYGMPSGYFITASTVATAGRSAQRGRSPWLSDLESVYPNEEIPFWMWSNYFYKEMGPILRWCLVPFVVLFSVSVIIWIGQALEEAGILHTALFYVNPGKNFGVPGHLLDWVIWVDTTVISLLLILAIPLYLLARDIRGTIRRYGIETREGLKFEKDTAYAAAAKSIFELDPMVVLYIYGHTHIPSMRKVGSRYIINTGTWLKRLDRVRAHLRLVPDVYVPSYRLNWFTIRQEAGNIRVSYQMLPKEAPDDLSWLEKVMIFGRHKPKEEQIPSETVIELPVKEGGSV